MRVVSNRGASGAICIVACSGLVPSLLLGGCFDVEQVDVDDPDGTGTTSSPLLVDDFESGNGVPTSESFSPWLCVFQETACGDAPGFNSEHGYALMFEVQTRTSGETLDFTRYENIGFSITLDPGAEGASNRFLTIRLFCPTESDPSGVFSAISSSLEVGTAWDGHELEVALFRELTFGEQPRIDENTCAREVAGLGFFLEPNPLDGADTGTLTIDNVYLQ